MFGNVVAGVRRKPVRERAGPDQDGARRRRRRRSDGARISSRWWRSTADLPAETGEEFPQDPTRAARPRGRRGVLAPGTRPRAHATGASTTSPTTWAPPSTSSRWCSATWATTPRTGVCFTRNPATGERELYGEFLINAQGEDVVAGIRTPQPLAELEAVMPEVLRAARSRPMERLEHHYRDMQDIEFTIERGTLYMLQTRTGKRTAPAAVRIARELVDEGVIDARGGACCGSTRAARPAAAPDDRSEGAAASVIARGLERLAGRGRRRRRVRRRHAPSGAGGGRGGDPGALGDDARRHPRRLAAAGRADGARRHDVARGGGRARHGQAVRGRRRAAPDRPRGAHLHRRRARRSGGRRDHASTARPARCSGRDAAGAAAARTRTSRR